MIIDFVIYIIKIYNLGDVNLLNKHSDLIYSILYRRTQYNVALDNVLAFVTKICPSTNARMNTRAGKNILTKK